MAKFLFKNANGDEVFSTDFEAEFKSIEHPETKKLDDYQLEIIGSTPAIDRDGESVDPSGWDLKNFKKNPVILLNHNYYGLPVAKAENVRVQEGKLVFKVRFPDEGVSPEADTVRKLAKGGFFNASSVGFIPREWKHGNSDKEPKRTSIKQELLELSIVTVPSNPEALISDKTFQPAIEKGLVTKEEIQNLIIAIENRKAAQTYTKAEVDQMLKSLREEFEKQISKVNETLEPTIKSIIENKHFEDLYEGIFKGESGPGAPEAFADIDAIIKAAQDGIKNAVTK